MICVYVTVSQRRRFAMRSVGGAGREVVNGSDGSAVMIVLPNFVVTTCSVFS